MSPTAGQTTLDVLNMAVDITSRFNTFVPLAEFAIESLWKIFKRDNPALTPDQFYEYLRSQGKAVEAFSADWLTAHGYTQDAEGNWVPPADPPGIPPPPPAPTS